MKAAAVQRLLGIAGLTAAMGFALPVPAQEVGPDNYDFLIQSQVTVERLTRDVEYVYLRCNLLEGEYEQPLSQSSTRLTPVNGTAQGAVTVYLRLENRADLPELDAVVCNIAVRCTTPYEGESSWYQDIMVRPGVWGGDLPLCRLLNDEATTRAGALVELP